MGEFEKLRMQEVRTKKARDDKINRQKELDNRQMR